MDDEVELWPDFTFYLKNTSNTGGEQLFSSSFKRDFFVFLAPENLFFCKGEWEQTSKQGSKWATHSFHACEGWNEANFL